MQNSETIEEKMMNDKNFDFKKTAYLIEVSGQKARNLNEFMSAISIVDRASIYFHLHQPMLISPEAQQEYPNDFAYWMAKEVGDYILAEKFANLELFRIQDLERIRREMVSYISQRLIAQPDGRNVADGREFVFCQSRSIVLDCARRAVNLREFRDALKEIDANSIYYHLVETKLRLNRESNDFAAWLQAIGEIELAHQVNSHDPYLTTLEGNRNVLVKLVDARLKVI
jgi:hypothetical protein